MKILQLLILATVASATAVVNGDFPTLKDVTKAFRTAEIVPEIVRVFNPSAFLYLVWPESKVVWPGVNLTKDATSSPPEVSVQGLPSSNPGPYLLALIDPDAPSRSDPKNAPFRHFLATDLFVSGELSEVIPVAWKIANDTAAKNEYQPPGPPPGSGPHRYIALLYSQPPSLDISFLDLSDRKHFNISAFASRAGLADPVAGAFFNVEVSDDDEGMDTEIRTEVITGQTVLH